MSSKRIIQKNSEVFDNIPNKQVVVSFNDSGVNSNLTEVAYPFVVKVSLSSLKMCQHHMYCMMMMMMMMMMMRQTERQLKI